MSEALPPDAELLSTTIYTEIAVLREPKILWVTRFSTAFPDIETAKKELAKTVELLSSQHHLYGLLLDIREVRGRNDSPFENILQEFREKIFRGFKGVAIVVRTAIGVLQVQRHGRETGVSAQVFRDIATARAYLASKLG